MTLKPQHVTQELLNKVTKALGITALDQWYYVSPTAVSQAIGSARALHSYGGTVGFLKSAYPHHSFDEEKLTSNKLLEKDQKFIEVIIRKLFPNVEIQTKARKAVGIKNPETDEYLEIDFWIPSLKLGIEYQDKHHYEYQWYANKSLEVYQRRDDVKKAVMPALGYTLIVIGYWWDKSLESIAATIRKSRPDLLLDYEKVPAEPMSSDPPLNDLTAPVIPDVAGLMSPFIPSNKFFDPTNWYAGEKHDGIRGVFNPKLNKMYSRSGNELSVFSSLLNDIPQMLVEGEVIAGRGNYNTTAAVSYHSNHGKVNWPLFRYVLYDIPDAAAGNYTQRYSVVTSGLLARPFIFAQSTFRILLDSKEHLKRIVNTIIGDAGEGVIVQKDAPYEYGRAKTLAKIKVRRDADAQVLHVNKHSCTCKLVSGVKADIVFCDGFDARNLNMEDVVSYYHNGYSQSGQPKHAEIYKVRYDMTWEQITSEKSHDVTRRLFNEATGGSSLLASNTARNNTRGYWNKQPNVRAFFDKFARTSGFDPLVPSNWYTVSNATLINSSGAGLLKAFSNNLTRALSSAYPELNFEASKFITRRNVRAFFDRFARTHAFDPRVPDNWYPISVAALRNASGDGILAAYGRNVRKALVYAYPELKFDPGKFKPSETTMRKGGHWNNPANVRTFFDEFATTYGFDPLVPENWYSVRTPTVQIDAGGGLLSAYKYNLKQALMDAYPEVKFEVEKFRARTRDKTKMARGHWTKVPNVRAFFDEFAQTNGFDPLVPDNWYQVTTKTLRNVGGGGPLGPYGYKLQKALSSAYPELIFDGERFRTCEKNYMLP